MKFIFVIEYTGAHCSQYQQIFLTPFMTYLKDGQPEVRQAAAYGCGVLAQVSKLTSINFFFIANLMFLVRRRSICRNLCSICSHFKSVSIGTR